MKRARLLGLAVAAVLTLAACGAHATDPAADPALAAGEALFDEGATFDAAVFK